MPSNDLPSTAASALLADYQFTEGTGTTVADSSGTTTAATFGGSNPPVWIAGKGAQIQADTSYVTVPCASASVQTALALVKLPPYNASSMGAYTSIIGNSGAGNFQYWITTQNRFVTSNSAQPDWYGLWSWADNGDTTSEGGVAPGSVSCLGWITQTASGGDNYWIDGQKWGASGSDSSTKNRGGTLQIGGSGYGSSVCPTGAIFLRVVFYSRALTDSEMSAATTALIATATNRGYTANDFANPLSTNKFAAEGDSITFGYDGASGGRLATPWPQGMTTAATYQRDNFGIYGEPLSKMLASGFNKIKKDYSPNAPKNVVTIFGGTNDLTNPDSGSSTATFNNLVSLVNLYLGQGWRVIVVPTLSNQSHDATGNAYNALIAAHSWPFGVQVIPTSTFPHLCGTGLYANTTWFGDGVHPTQAGANELAAGIGPFVDSAYSSVASLVPGTLSASSDTASSVGLSMSAITGGTAPYSSQLQRSPHSAGTWTNVGSPVVGASPTFTDATVSAATAYDYRAVVTDSTTPSAMTGNTATLAVSTPASSATSYTFTGPTTGLVNSASTAFTVTPNGLDTGTITVTPSGGGLSTPIVLTFSGSTAPQTFTITPTSAGTVTLAPVNSNGLANPASLSYTATPVVTYADGYQVTGFPSAPVVGTSYSFAYTLDGPASALGTITPTPQTGIAWGAATAIAAGGTGGTGTVVFGAAGTYTPAFTHTGLGFSGNPTLSAVTATAGSGGGSGSGLTLGQLNQALASGIITLGPSAFDLVQVEPGINARQALSPILAFSAGVLSGAGTGSIAIKAPGTSTNRINATTDSSGNRTSVTLNLPT